MGQTRASTKPTTRPPLPASNEPFQLTTSVSMSGSTIPTPTGTLLVRPYRSSSTSQLRAMVTFTPRTSTLDRENEKSGSEEFRGFYTLFWIGLFLLFCRTSLQSWEDNRTILSSSFGRLITGDALVLALIDGCMVGSMFICVPFVKGLQKGWYRYYWVGMLMQHLWQAAFLGVAIFWGYKRQWYWVQSGFLVLHALSMLMKMHSYCAHNGMLSDIHSRLISEQAHLARLLSSTPDGGASIRAAALAAQHEHEAIIAEEKAKLAKAETAGMMDVPIGTPAIPTGSTAVSTGYLSHADTLRLRLAPTEKGNGTSLSVSSATSTTASTPTSSIDPAASPVPLGTSLEPSHSTTPHAPTPSNPLTFSTNKEIATLAHNIDLMKDELKGNGPKGITWPANVTYYSFADYMLVPTLVYELEYPRTNVMRPMYVAEKVFATFGVFSLIYTITEHYIMPLTPKPGDSMIKSFVNLALPMMFNYLLIFYIIFECICNGFAELTYFADREFYQDWWNSTSFDQFARKWNKPVHTFLLRHVYTSTINNYKLSKTAAMFLTFLLSALVHELVMAVVSRKFRGWLFFAQMGQIPLSLCAQTKLVKRNKTLGNVLFWIGLMSGFPLLAIAYLVY